jgi:hypothetical protein
MALPSTAHVRADWVPHINWNASDTNRAPRAYFRWRRQTVYVPAHVQDPEQYMADFLEAQASP